MNVVVIVTTKTAIIIHAKGQESSEGANNRTLNVIPVYRNGLTKMWAE